jgi:microtubule-associated protein-like 6
LFRYPCPVEKASFNPYIGHSSHVTCVKFSASNDYLISTGGNDKSIFQWRFIKDNDEKVIFEDSENIVEEDYKSSSLKVEKLQGTQFGASKPFLGEVKASTPKNFIPSKGAGEIPSENIKLKYIHGYRGFDSKDNVKFTSKGDVLFHSAAVDIVLDIKSNNQSFFSSHEDDIVSLALHPNVYSFKFRVVSLLQVK